MLVADIVADEEAFAIEQSFVKASGKVIAGTIALRHLEYTYLGVSVFKMTTVEEASDRAA